MKEQVPIDPDAIAATEDEGSLHEILPDLAYQRLAIVNVVDWEAARTSVQRLAALEPEVVISGHGRPLHGPAMRQALHTLADDFVRIAVPEHGRYV